MRAEIRYARSTAAHIAYTVSGSGPPDLLLVPDGWVPIAAMPDEPNLDRFLERLASFSRLLCFDRRGMGQSDPPDPADPPTLERWVEDAIAVLDAVGTARAAVLGIAEGGFVATLLAATHPERVEALVLVNSAACFSRPPFLEWGALARLRQVQRDSILDNRWGDDETGVEIFAPSAYRDESYRAWLRREVRQSVSPASARLLAHLLHESDVSDALARVEVPTLVVHRAGDAWLTPEHGRYLAEHIPDARYVEVPGDDHVVYLGDPDPILGEIEEFLTGTRQVEHVDRLLATMLFTDIVESTTRAAELGDRAWRALLDRHDAAVRRLLDRYQGREQKTTGDGFLATFDSPARAIRCAAAIRDATREFGVSVRAGLHAGECEIRGDELAGIAVHIAQRVQAEAEPDEVLVSSTVRDLVTGSGIRFTDRGERHLKGVPEPWRLFVVEAA
jgi:pimeloyl-ACP methyl ester carboxylesterase